MLHIKIAAETLIISLVNIYMIHKQHQIKTIVGYYRQRAVAFLPHNQLRIMSLHAVSTVHLTILPYHSRLQLTILDFSTASNSFCMEKGGVFFGIKSVKISTSYLPIQSRSMNISKQMLLYTHMRCTYMKEARKQDRNTRQGEPKDRSGAYIQRTTFVHVSNREAKP